MKMSSTSSVTVEMSVCSTSTYSVSIYKLDVDCRRVTSFPVPPCLGSVLGKLYETARREVRLMVVTLQNDNDSVVSEVNQRLFTCIVPVHMPSKFVFY